MNDPLTEVLRSVRLHGGVFLDAHFTAPWCVQSQLSATECAQFFTSPTHIIGYHFVIEGELEATADGERTENLRAGEVVLFPRNDPHTLGDKIAPTTIFGRDLVQTSPEGGLLRISHGGGGAKTHIVCGFLASDELYNPLIQTLPRMLKLDVREGASRDWVEASVRMAADELVKGRMADSGLMSRLSELLFVEAVRDYAATLGEQETGWLRGLADQQIGKALAMMHQNPSAPWSAESLAKAVGQSRSAFVDRFTALVGMPPIRYLTAWRLQTAKLNLRETRKTVAQLAHSVGYESEEAFSRAFKREFGMPPARWREQAAVTASPA